MCASSAGSCLSGPEEGRQLEVTQVQNTEFKVACKSGQLMPVIWAPI